MLLEKLEQEGIKKELEALGYNCEEIFGGGDGSAVRVLFLAEDSLYGRRNPGVCDSRGSAEGASGERLSLGGVVYSVR